MGFCEMHHTSCEIVEVRTGRGVRPAALFPKAILEAEWAAIRETIVFKRERW